MFGFMLLTLFSFQWVYSDEIKEKHLFPNDKEHDKEYDRLKFLGEFEMKNAKKMNPRQARKELIRIIREVDFNNDGFVTKDELAIRLKNVHDAYINQTSLEMWQSQNPLNHSEVTWEDIVNNSYSFIHLKSPDAQTKKHGMIEMEKDKIRFEIADFDKNKQLSWSEYVNFVHPESSPVTRHLVVNETMNDMDKNKDGFVDIEEYIEDISKNYERDKTLDSEWIQQEKDNFKNHRDINKDGKLDIHELTKMIQPDGFDPIESEASYLLRESDDNKDNKLSPEEMLAHSDLFINNTSLNIIRDEL